MAHVNFKNLSRRAASDKVLCNKAFNIAKTPIYDGFHRGIASLIYTFFDKTSSSSGAKSEIIPKQQLAEELHKRIIKKSKKRKQLSSFKDSIWGADLAVMHLISNFSNWAHFLLSVIYTYCKCVWDAPLKDKERYYNY